MIITQAKPDVVLMDVDLPVMGGIVTARKIKENYPHTNILILTGYNSNEIISKAVDAGVQGYMVKEDSMEDLFLAIKAVASGGSYFSKSVSPILLGEIRYRHGRELSKKKFELQDKITNREMEVLEFVAEELTNKEIAAKLFISPRTVETHKRNLIQKLKVKNTIGLVKYYWNRGSSQITIN